MVAGAIIYRSVNPNRPGEPSLDDPSTELQFRREYYCGGDPAWTRDVTEAKYFPNHLEADDFVKTLGGLNAGIHARVTPPIDEEEIPERLRPLEPLQVLPPPPAYPAKKKQRKKAGVRPSVPVERRRDWVKETYG